MEDLLEHVKKWLLIAGASLLVLMVIILTTYLAVEITLAIGGLFGALIGLVVIVVGVSIFMGIIDWFE